MERVKLEKETAETQAREERITRWSSMYGIERRIIEGMYDADHSLTTSYNNPNSLLTILKKNSELLQKFLGSLPAPEIAEDCFGIDVTLLFPNALSQALGAMDALYHTFFRTQEFATRFWDRGGTEFYAGPTETYTSKTRLLLPTFVDSIGFWENGYRTLVERELPAMIQKGFFVYEMVLGHSYDHRERKSILGDQEVGVSAPQVLWYNAIPRFWNPSSFLCHAYLENYWSDRSMTVLQEHIKAFNATVFRRENRETAPMDLSELLPS